MSSLLKQVKLPSGSESTERLDGNDLVPSSYDRVEAQLEEEIARCTLSLSQLQASGKSTASDTSKETEIRGEIYVFHQMKQKLAEKKGSATPQARPAYEDPEAMRKTAVSFLQKTHPSK